MTQEQVIKLISYVVIALASIAGIIGAGRNKASWVIAATIVIIAAMWVVP